tara:strand:+ start:685 stop:1065 length:381 start_codon:yes stop_codon:yes gene_type:complete
MMPMTRTIQIIHPDGFTRTYRQEGELKDTHETIAQRAFDEWNHGSACEVKDFLSAKCRSLSVGDFVGIGAAFLMVKGCGFEMVKLAYVNGVLDSIRADVAKGAPLSAMAAIHEATSEPVWRHIESI